MPHRVPTPEAYLAYDVRFHEGCAHVTLAYPYLYCQDCRVVAHIDLVADHVSPADAKLIGKGE